MFRKRENFCWEYSYFTSKSLSGELGSQGNETEVIWRHFRVKKLRNKLIAANNLLRIILVGRYVCQNLLGFWNYIFLNQQYHFNQLLCWQTSKLSKEAGEYESCWRQYTWTLSKKLRSMCPETNFININILIKLSSYSY